MSALIECNSIQGQVIKTRTGFPGAVGASIKRTAERAVGVDRIPLDPEPSDQNALTISTIFHYFSDDAIAVGVYFEGGCRRSFRLRGFDNRGASSDCQGSGAFLRPRR